MDDARLVELALEAREHAYAPYSHWTVGAALLCADGTVYQGCNIENAAYTPSNCAERTAFFKAVFDGQRHFEAMAVVGGPQGQPAPDYCAPCGVCRQVMMEFCDPETFRIVLGRSDGERRVYLLRELLPEAFGPSNLS
ncbi:MAG: cytidine deaminase [Coriobacteriales bacterium]|nr:cytidine deaminase [Coriobacteriales bacterium]